MTRTRLVLALALALVGCATTATPTTDAAPRGDTGPGTDAGVHIPRCDAIGELPHCPDGYPLVCPNGRWDRPDGLNCVAIAYMGEQPPACTEIGDITTVPRCAHGLPSCLEPDPVSRCPD